MAIILGKGNELTIIKETKSHYIVMTGNGKYARISKHHNKHREAGKIRLSK